MPRLSIDVSPEQHKAIKARALLNDLTVRDYALERLLPQEQVEMDFPHVPTERDPKYADWEEELQAIIREGLDAEPVEVTVDELIEEALESLAMKSKAA